MSAILMDNISQYSTGSESHTNSNTNPFDDIGSTIKLKLKKPCAWKWELSTSKSSPSIAFPKILLYDDKGDLLAETQESENIFNSYRGKDDKPISRSSSKDRSFSSSINSTVNNYNLSKFKKLSQKSSSSASSTSGKAKNQQHRRSSIANIPEVRENLSCFVDSLKSEGINCNVNLLGDEISSTSCNSEKVRRKGSINNLCIKNKRTDTNTEHQNPNTNINSHVLNTNKTIRLDEKCHSRSPSNESNNIGYYNSHYNKIFANNDKALSSPTNLDETIWNKRENSSVQRDMNIVQELRPIRKRYVKSKSVNLETLMEEEKTGIDSEHAAKTMRKSEKSLTPLKEVRFDLKKSKSTTDILLSKERKKCHRTNSNSAIPSKFSKSILERLSASKNGSSSESQDIEMVEENKPRYFLRTSNAGTLVVCEESFRGRKLRRRPKSVPRILDYNDENCDEKTERNLKFYDKEISKLDKLISKASSIIKTTSTGNLNNNSNKLNCDLYYNNTESVRGKSVDNELSKSLKSKNGTKKSLSDIRRCMSAGNVWISSDDDENAEQPKKEVKLRRKRKIHPIKANAKGDRILAINNANLITSLQSSVSPTHHINEKASDELLIRFVQSFASLKQNHNHQLEKNDFNDSANVENDSILRENDDYIDFEVIKSPRNARQINTEPLLVDNNTFNCNHIIDQNVVLDYHCIDDINNNSCIYSVNEDCSPEQVSSGDDLITVRENNMGSNVSRNSSKHQEQLHHPRRRTHSSGDIHGNKHNKNNSQNSSNDVFHHLSLNNPNDKLSTIPGYGQSLPLNDDSRGRVSSTVDETINHLITDRDKQHIAVAQSATTTTVGDIETSKQRFYHNQQNNSERIPMITTTDCGVVTREDRNKFRGSLPNHLDCDTFVNDDDLEDCVRNHLTKNVTNFNSSNSNQHKTDLSTNLVEYVTVTPNWQQQQHHQYQKQQNNSPYHVSDKETASTSSGSGPSGGNVCGNVSDASSSTFKINQDKPDIQLTLPLVRNNFDPSCDQGYGSERSPEDELPPSTLSSLENTENVQQHLNSNWNNPNHYVTDFQYNFITEDCTFSVQIVKGPRGWGLSISGGVDTNTAFPGLIRIKRLFPHQAAWLTGKLQQGDIILEANGIPLTGLTNYEALEVLRTMPNDVVLLICRPIDEQYIKLSPPTEPPKPPQRTQQQSIHTQTFPEELSILYLVDASSGPVVQTNSSGEFEIFMVKQQGSLGFTLSKEDESILGHYVRALVREPATTDGRIKPGDKIVAVNDVPLSPMTHAQAVIFLRQSADVVKLRLYRDEAQTPIEPTSPTLSENKSNCGSGKKVILRPEALNLLTDLAHKKQNSHGDSTESSNISTGSSPRRLKRGHKSQSPQSNCNAAGVVFNKITVGSDSDQSIDSQCSYLLQPVETTESEISTASRNNRPTSLELGGGSNEIEKSSNGTRKPNYQFLACNKNYELNNLDNDDLDAPFFNESAVHDNSDGGRFGNNLPPEINEFTSLPCEALIGTALKLSNTEFENESTDVCHKNPLYQSVHVQQNQQKNPTDDIRGSNPATKYGHESLLKWKGVVLTEANENDKENEHTGNHLPVVVRPGDHQSSFPHPNENSSGAVNEFSSQFPEGYKVLSVELNRGWNSRLGFSLQPNPNFNSRSVISAIYSDSVAARDGRLRAGDVLISVNDEPVENMSTSDIIDFLRIIRGAILITVLRKDP